MLCSFQVYSKVIQLYIYIHTHTYIFSDLAIQLYIYIFFSRFFSIKAYYKILNTVLYSKNLLGICFAYHSVFLLIPNSQFIPPAPSPLVTISLFSL